MFFVIFLVLFFFFKQKTAYEMRISDWSSDVCSSDLFVVAERAMVGGRRKIIVKAVGGRGTKGDLGAGKQRLHRLCRSEERRVGKECVVRVDLGGRSIIKKKKETHNNECRIDKTQK